MVHGVIIIVVVASPPPLMRLFVVVFVLLVWYIGMAMLRYGPLVDHHLNHRIDRACSISELLP